MRVSDVLVGVMSYLRATQDWGSRTLTARLRLTQQPSCGHHVTDRQPLGLHDMQLQQGFAIVALP